MKGKRKLTSAVLTGVESLEENTAFRDNPERVDRLLHFIDTYIEHEKELGDLVEV